MRRAGGVPTAAAAADDEAQSRGAEAAAEASLSSLALPRRRTGLQLDASSRGAGTRGGALAYALAGGTHPPLATAGLPGGSLWAREGAWRGGVRSGQSVRCCVYHASALAMEPRG